MLLVTMSALFAVFMVNLNYRPVRSGKLYLESAQGNSSLFREYDTGIHHIKAENYLGAVYTQGFAHAQDRLWQMEKSRRMTSGRLSEIFGDKSLNVDKFSLTLGYRKVAQETWDDPDSLSDEVRQQLQAYTDGVNDFINGVGYFHDEITAFYLPPEFYALGIEAE